MVGELESDRQGKGVVFSMVVGCRLLPFHIAEEHRIFVNIASDFDDSSDLIAPSPVSSVSDQYFTVMLLIVFYCSSSAY